MPSCTRIGASHRDDASAPERNSEVYATSDGAAMLCSGTIGERLLASARASENGLPIAVSMPPGCTEFTRTPLCPYSIAAALVRPRMPHLLALYADRLFAPFMPSTDELLTMLP